MDLVSAYKSIRQSIVAFTPKYIPVQSGDSPPQFPPIFGTGFVVREDGIIVTNAHVVREFKKLPMPTDIGDEWPVTAIMFRLTEQGMLEMCLQIVGAGLISAFEPGGKAYYGPPHGPDMAFVHVKARGLPAVRIDSTTVLEEGIELATAGFPMGTDALMAPGWLHQLTPTLQKGIISAVLPFSCKYPHAYAINVMSQGGASGSPVFLPASAEVVGVLYSGLVDFEKTLDAETGEKKDHYEVPTNISHVVPSHYLERSIEQFAASPHFTVPPDTPTIDEMIATSSTRNVIEEGRGWAVRTDKKDK